MWWMPLIALGTSALKMKQDAKAQRRDAELSSEIARYSPWTGMNVPQINYAKPADTMMQGFGSAMAMHQDQQRQGKINNLLDTYTKRAAAGGGGDAGTMTSDLGLLSLFGGLA